MKIYDCFMYFDEEVVVDVRFNTLDKFVDYFVIIESRFTHKGDFRELKFNHKKFEKFKSKIIYLIYEDIPKDIQIINKDDPPKHKSWKGIENAMYRENGQRNFISKGLNHANEDDFILISDVDEIPNLSGVNFAKLKQKIILFKQNMFYYKFNLAIPDFNWTGTKGCKKKKFNFSTMA